MQCSSVVTLLSKNCRFDISFAVVQALNVPAAACCCCCCCCCPLQGPKPAERLAKGEPEGSEYDYESKIDFAVFPSLQVRFLLLVVCVVHACTGALALQQLVFLY
jgi:hypothetical protein